MSKKNKNTFKLSEFSKDRLQSILDSSEMTQAEIAKITGMTQANISYMFNKKLDSISYNILDILSEALEFNVDYILQESCTSKKANINPDLWLESSGIVIDFIKKEKLMMNAENISSLTLSLHNHIAGKVFPVSEAHTYLRGQVDFWIKMRTIGRAPN